MNRDFPTLFRVAGIWLIYATWASLCGWVLSALHCLNASGYAIAALPGIAAVIAWWRYSRPTRPLARSGIRGLRRLKTSPAFAGWAGVSLLILIGALANAPTNHDGLTYRLPRLLYWIQENGWFWIDGIDFRMDIAGVGSEWMMAPLLLLFRTDRVLFLLNFLPFLLLPGLFFSAALGLGLRAKIASRWMWIWPLAYGLAMQAGSIGNDALGAALGLAALAFAAEARHGHPRVCLVLSALAAALMTGIKVTTLPLGLPIAVFWIWQAWHLLGMRPMLRTGLGIAPVAILCSFLPIALLCWKNTGSWNANPNNRLGIETEHPVAGIVGNGIDVAQEALALPVFPGVKKLDAWVAKRTDHWPPYRWVADRYPSYDLRISNELPTEERSGIGLGVSLLALLWCAAALWKRPAGPSGRTLIGLVFIGAVVISFLTFLAKAGGDDSPRLMLPFTPFLALGLLLCLPSSLRFPNKHWAWLPALFLIPTLLLNPNRPLISGTTVALLPGVPVSIKNRLTEVGKVYRARNDLLSSLREVIPAGSTVAFAGDGDNPSYSLFKPFGRLSIIDLKPSREARADWVVGTRKGIELRTGKTLEDWERSRFVRLRERVITDKVSWGPETWFVWRRGA